MVQKFGGPRACMHAVRQSALCLGRAALSPCFLGSLACIGHFVECLDRGELLRALARNGSLKLQAQGQKRQNRSQRNSELRAWIGGPPGSSATSRTTQVCKLL